MNQQLRLDLYREYMAAKGVEPRISTPVIWEFLWRQGLDVPPPPFVNPVLLGLIYTAVGLALPLFLGALFALRELPFRFHFPPWKVIEAMMIGSALLMGLGTPIYYRALARRCGLGSWRTFSGHRQRPLP